MLFKFPTIQDVYTASLSTPYLYMEDVFVTGLVLRKIPGVKLFPKYKFLVKFPQHYNSKQMLLWSFDEIFVQHNFFVK